MANRGPLYGLSKDCRIKASKKFDIKQVREVLHWIEAVLGRKVHEDIDSLYTERDAASVLKNGVALCELMNVVSPGSIKRINRQQAAFKQMENLEMFTKACVDYGLRQLDVFQIADLFEVKAIYTVYNCLHALGSLAQKNGFSGPNYGVRISEKKERHFSTEQIAQGKMIIPMQAGTNVVPSQAGMTPYGFSRQIVPSDVEQTVVPPSSTNVISLQYGTNSMGSQKGMTPYGLTRQITLSQSDEPPVFDIDTNPEVDHEGHGDLCNSSSDKKDEGDNIKDDNAADAFAFEDNGLESSTLVEEREDEIKEVENEFVNNVESGDANGTVSDHCRENGNDIVSKDVVGECCKKEVNGDGTDWDDLQINGS